MMIRMTHALPAVIASLAFGACADNDDGPVERFGERVDDAMEEARERLDDAADEAREAAEEIGDALQGE